MATTAERVLSRTTKSTIDWASDHLNLSYEHIGNTLGADRRTIHRWVRYETIPSPRHQERVERLQQLRFLMEAVFKDAESAQEWLLSPAPSLRGRTPVSRLRDGDIDTIIEILSTLASGGFV